MKRTLIAATIAGLTIPVGFAGPASAYIIGNELTLSVDNSKGTEPMTVDAQLTCGRDLTATTFGYTVLNDVVPAGETRGEVPSCTLPMDSSGEWAVTRDGVECRGSIANPLIGKLEAALYKGENCPWSVITKGPTEYTPYFQWEKNNDGVYNLTVYSPEKWQEVSAPSTTAASAAVDVNTADARSKDTGYVTLQPGRVTAMAKRFINHPGDMVNIHAYGPDQDVALARAEHVHDHLLTEITRFGGDPDAYPVMVTYAGDPAHKKNVHVTIHQHAASSITVPEGGTLTIGGSS